MSTATIATVTTDLLQIPLLRLLLAWAVDNASHDGNGDAGEVASALRDLSGDLRRETGLRSGRLICDYFERARLKRAPISWKSKG